MFRSVRYTSICLAILASVGAAPAHAMCTDRQQPIFISITDVGQFYVQERSMTSGSEAVKLAEGLGGGCIMVRADPKADWSAVASVLVPLASMGNLGPVPSLPIMIIKDGKMQAVPSEDQFEPQMLRWQP